MTRAGFTMVEVTIALVILGLGILGIASSAGRLGTVANGAEVAALALQSVNDRLSMARMHPRYGVLDSLFTDTETDLASLPGYERITDVSRTQVAGNSGKTVDYTRITVTVKGPGLPEGLSRSIVRAAP